MYLKVCVGGGWGLFQTKFFVVVKPESTSTEISLLLTSLEQDQVCGAFLKHYIHDKILLV